MNNELFAHKNRLVIAIMAVMFTIYNITVYTQGTSKITHKMSKKALLGEKLYQDNNCTACHQLFGLGGYLGPDLTNIASNKHKGEDYIKAFLNSGIKTMPKFNFNKNEQEAIVTFLTEVDQCGFYPVLITEKNTTGWVEIPYKNQ